MCFNILPDFANRYFGQDQDVNILYIQKSGITAQCDQILNLRLIMIIQSKFLRLSRLHFFKNI